MRFGDLMTLAQIRILAEAQRRLDLAHFEGAMLAVAVVSAALAFLLLARGQKRLARLPLGMLIAYLILRGLHQTLPTDIDAHLPIRFFGITLLMFSIGRSGFLLAFRSVPGAKFVAGWPKIMLDVVQGLVYVVAFLIALYFAGVDLTSLVTGSALVTAAIGLSMRDTLGNVFAGLAIQAQEPFTVGDWIQFDEHPHHVGEVIEVNWRVTKVQTLDKVEVTIPNGVLAQSPIRNFTKPTAFSRRSVYVVAPYDVPPRQVQRLILDAIADSFGVLSDPAPSVVSNGFTERGVEYWVRFFTVLFDQRDRVDGGVRDRIWYALQRHGVKIPGPIRQVQIERTPETEQIEEIARYENRFEMLRNVDFLEGLPDEAIKRLAASAKRRVYAEGETIIKEGDAGYELFIIVRGEVAILRRRRGVETQVGRLGPTKFFGEMSCMTGANRVATVRAVADCELLVVDKPAVQPILAESPDLAQHISEVLAQRQEELERHAKDGQQSRTAASSAQTKTDLLMRIKDFFSI